MRRNFYVSMGRAREAMHLFTDSKVALKEGRGGAEREDERAGVDGAGPQNGPVAEVAKTPRSDKRPRRSTSDRE
jgi:hypothetical protein